LRALERFLEPLDNVRAAGEGYTASCPAPDHGGGNGDRNPSLSVGVDDEGNVLVNCFAGCDKEAIVSSVGLTLADLFERRNGPKRIRGARDRPDGPAPSTTTRAT
jgi:putative DNA primase/helicase